jgi:hypothetical protein
MNLEKYSTACGSSITVSAHVQRHLQAHPDVIEHLSEAIRKIQLPGERSDIACEVQMGRVVGNCGLVKTGTLKITDAASFAVRTNRRFPSRIAPQGVAGSASSTIVVIAKPAIAGDHYELITAWVGIIAKKEPWDANIIDQNEFNECLYFWSTTALVHDPLTMGPLLESSWKEILTQSKSRFCVDGLS